jgi:aerobic carbon-monoxide dehydrogenase medium subunit
VKPVDFTLHRPDTLDEAVELLGEHGDESKVLAGGQSLVPLLNFRLARPEHLVDLGRIEGLATLRRTTDRLTVGAMVRQASAEASPAVAQDVPLLAAAMPNIAHPPIRGRGTVGGSLAHGDPAAELPAVARALDVTFVAVSPRGRREIGCAEFFHGNLMTDLAVDEILTEVLFPRATPGTGAAFLEVGRRQGDFALVGVGAQVSLRPDRTVEQARICLTGVAPIPHRASDAENLLVDKIIEDRGLSVVADAVRDGIDPTGDLHATAAYRKDVAGTLTARALRDAYRRAAGSVAGHDTAA